MFYSERSLSLSRCPTEDKKRNRSASQQKPLENLCGGKEIRSGAYLVSSFDLNSIPSLERDELPVLLV